MPCLDYNYLKKHIENIENFNSCFVETGTFMGTTINNVEPYFSELHTIEIKEGYYNRAKNMYKGDKIKFHLGNSSDKLVNICKSLKTDTVFFLDGHWSSGGTGRGVKDTPLYEELESIMENLEHNAIIIIDDVRLFGKGPNKVNEDYDICNWEDISTDNLLKKVESRIKNYYFTPSSLDTKDRLVINIKSKYYVELPLYYINLDKRTLRREEFEKQIKIHNLSIERISAFDGCALPERISIHIQKGQYGCWMSHIEFWQKSYRKNTPCIVFEDDIYLCDNFCEKVNFVFEHSKKLDWDILLLAHNWFNRKDKITDYISQMFRFHGTQCYIIKPNCAKFLLNKYSNFKEIPNNIDVELGNLNINGEIKIIGTTEKLVILSRLAGASDTNRG